MVEATKQRKESARYYLFEEVLEQTPGFARLRQRRSIADLQLYAGFVWAREGGRGACPMIFPRHTADYSYFDDDTHRVFLARKHRNVGAMLHELAHAFGCWDKLTHGPAFRRRCLRLYQVYGDWDGRISWETS